MKPSFRSIVCVVVFSVAAGVGCAKPARAPRLPESATVLHSYPHDPSAFTQGLLVHEGKLYESTGLNGRSSLRRVDLASGVVEQQVDLPASFFGEGLARVGSRLIQLTWQNHVALVWDLATFKKEREIAYEGEGWGLCFDGKRLIMSDGSSHLTFRDPSTFAEIGRIEVRREGAPVHNLNELECVDGVVFANIWQDDHIARIDVQTGWVTAWIDAAGLLSPAESQGTDVLNGIAYLPATGNLLVTGKLWPRTFEIRLPRP